MCYITVIEYWHPRFIPPFALIDIDAYATPTRAHLNQLWYPTPLSYKLEEIISLINLLHSLESPVLYCTVCIKNHNILLIIIIY